MSLMIMKTIIIRLIFCCLLFFQDTRAQFLMFCLFPLPFPILSHFQAGSPAAAVKLSINMICCPFFLVSSFLIVLLLQL